MTASAYPHSALSLLVQSSRVSTPLRAAVAEVEAYLAELDAKVEAMEPRIQSAVQKVCDRFNMFRPPCPTCGGTLTVRAATPSPETAGAARCPNCDDGKVSVARMAAVYKLLVDHMHPESPISEEIRSFCRYAVMECNVK